MFTVYLTYPGNPVYKNVCVYIYIYTLCIDINIYIYTLYAYVCIYIYMDIPPVQKYRSKPETAIIIIADCLHFRRFCFLPFQFALCTILGS